MALSFDFAALVGVFTGLAAAIDIRQHRIPNYLTVTAAVLGLLYNTFMPSGLGILSSLGGFAIGFLLLIIPWIVGGGGMGDVKLLAALGAWLGPKMLLIAFSISAVLAAILAMGIISYSAVTKGFARTKNKYIGSAATGGAKKNKKDDAPLKRRRVLPFAVPVCVSTWLILVWMVYKTTL